MEKNLTTGSVFKNVVLFSLPYLLSYFLQTLYGMADLFIIGQFEGVASTTAVSIGSQVMHMLTVMIVGLSMGTTVSVGQAVGAGDRKQAAHNIGNTVILFLVVSIALTAILLSLVHPIVVAMSTPTDAVSGTVTYLTICFIGIPFITSYNIISSIFRGLGDSKSPMCFIATACAANIALDYLFMGVLHLGPAGAALGTTLSQAISVVVSLTVILKRRSIVLKKSDFKPCRAVMGKILGIGIPIAFQDGLIQVAFIIITIIANQRGLNDAAAVGIVEKVISFLFLVPSSMLSTVSALGAQNIGAGKPERAIQTLRYAVMLAAGFGVLASIAIQFTAEGMLVNSLYNIIDSFFVAQISEEAMTALSLVYPVQNFINAVGIGFGVGINAVIAFHLGAGDHEKADQAATQGLVLAVIHGVVMTVCCITIMPVFLRMFTSSEAVIELGVRYSVVAFAFTLIVTVSMAFEKLFQAVGNMKTTMISLMCGCITNIVLDPVLIFGYGPFPEMGIEGAALATGIGQALTLTIYLVVYLARPIRVHIRRQYILPSKKMVIKLYSIGIPATLNLALPSLLISALNAILAAYSEVYILVLGIYYKLQTFIYLPANGIVQGMRPLIGYNYGAGEHQRVSQIFKIVLCMSGIIMVLGTVICLLIPGQLMGLFTHTEATIQTGETALRIIGAGFIVSAVSVTSSGALEGLGKGTPSLLISLCRYVVVIIPTAFLLSRFFGAVGVWNAFWITEAITAIISICVYYKAIAQSQLSQSTVK